MRFLVVGLAALVVLLVAIQFVPFGRNHQNPPVQATAIWDSPGTQSRFAVACGDCHSNETRWPWYSRMAPMSWLVQRDVEEGREAFNISEHDWGDADEAAETVIEGEMPPLPYLLLHPEARLSAREKQDLVTGLQATFGDMDASDETD